MTTKTYWRVEWTSPRTGSCAVSSVHGPNDAKAQAARYIWEYPADTKYTLVKRVETDETLEIFTANTIGQLGLVDKVKMT